MEQPAPVGAHVRVPFRGKNRRGIVVELLEEPDVGKTLPVKETLGPGLPEDLVDLARWLSARYLSTFGEALAAVMPERVVSEEEASTQRAQDIQSPGSASLKAYRHGDALAHALEAGSPGGYVWRPGTDEDRAKAIAGFVSVAARKERGVLVLVPEVATSETARALTETFGEAVASLGSDRSARERYRDWLALRDGSKRIAVGGRGAVFAPVGKLGLIVIDDESHVAYKDARAPRYHARTVAGERARRVDATLVLVGIPPSVEAWSATLKGPYTLVSVPRDAERKTRAPINVIDEKTRLVPSGKTMTLAKKVLNEGKRVVVLTHRSGEEAKRVAERVFRILAPHSPSLLDAKTPRAQLQRALQKSDVIVATPVIAKDVHPNGVGLLAIVEADAALTQPGFRAPEEAFATWWRAARWAERVAIETEDRKHPAITALVRWDPDVLARAEAARRKEAGYPPFAALARIDVPADRARAVAKELSELKGIEILGPVERDEGGAAVVARARRRDTLLAALGPVVTEWRRKDEPMRVDVDPWEVLVPKWRS